MKDWPSAYAQLLIQTGQRKEHYIIQTGLREEKKDKSHQEARCLWPGPCGRGPGCSLDGVQPHLQREMPAQTKPLVRAASEERRQRSEFLSKENLKINISLNLLTLPDTLHKYLETNITYNIIP